LNGKLYVAGGFTTFNGIVANHVVSFDGSSWSALGSGLGPTQNTILSIDAFQGSIYAGGAFTTAGGVAANHIAKWAISTGINEMTELETIDIYPNPFTGDFILHLKNVCTRYFDISILDINGKLIYNSKEEIYQNDMVKTMDLSDYPPGVYFLKILTDDQKYVKKLIKI
jgi:hypothetical protein